MCGFPGFGSQTLLFMACMGNVLTYWAQPAEILAQEVKQDLYRRFPDHIWRHMPQANS